MARSRFSPGDLIYFPIPNSPLYYNVGYGVVLRGGKAFVAMERRSMRGGYKVERTSIPDNASLLTAEQSQGLPQMLTIALTAVRVAVVG